MATPPTLDADADADAVGVAVADDAVAVVGLSCRLPGARDPEEFWRLLSGGRSAVSDAVPGRAVPEDLFGPGTAVRAGFVEDVDLFDPAMFGVSPREAAFMDPRQRILLELVWQAFEDAGLRTDDLAGSDTATFVGAGGDDYATLTDRLGLVGASEHAFTGTLRALLANRISYTFGLRGPSLVVDTAQSSSLTAVHLAAESVRAGRTGLAIAAGISLNILPEGWLGPGRLGALSPDGRCYTFDARANGYVRGEGGGVVLLKRLEAARRDGDKVYCVVAGSATNNDGGGASLTAPNLQAQEDVLRRAYRAAGVDPVSVSFVELHGTGTLTGDPIEASALGAVLGADRRDGDPLPVGSVKTNIGHLEGAAGIAGLIKAVLCLDRGYLVPSLNFDTPNPRIDLDALRLAVQTRLAPAPPHAGPATAGVSSFGVGGANVHVVLRALTRPVAAAAARPPAEPGDGGGVPVPVPVPLSGREGAALRARAGQVRGLLDGDQPASPTDVSYSLAGVPRHEPERAVVVGRGARELADRLSLLASTGVAEGRPGVVTGRARAGAGVVLVFPGQGSGWPGMGLELLGATGPAAQAFGDQLARCEAALLPFVDFSVVDVLDDAEALERLDVLQPVLWAVMVSLAASWRAVGVRPAAVLGHSQGEVAAACVAGALSLDDGARVVALRSRLLALLPPVGAMASVGLGAERVAGDLTRYAGQISLAAVNGPASVVVSGAADAVADLVAGYERQGTWVRSVPTRVAGHSAQIDGIRADLLTGLAPVRPLAAAVPFYSTVTGGELDPSELDGRYWWRNAREPVLFAPTLERVLARGFHVFVEVGAHPVVSLGTEEVAAQAGSDATVVGTLRRGEGGLQRFYQSVGEAWVSGAEVDWIGVFAGTGARRTALPSYPFQRRRCWLPGSSLGRPAAPARGPVDHTDPGAALEAEQGADVADDRGDQTLGERLGQLPSGERRRVLTRLVVEQAAVVLGHEASAVDPHLSFREQGCDSAAAVSVRRRLSAALGVKVPVTATFDHPTPAALAAFLLREFFEASGPVGHGPASSAGSTWDGSTWDGSTVADSTFDELHIDQMDAASLVRLAFRDADS